VGLGLARCGTAGRREVTLESAGGGALFVVTLRERVVKSRGSSREEPFWLDSELSVILGSIPERAALFGIRKPDLADELPSASGS
jgi:hypothetical protein